MAAGVSHTPDEGPLPTPSASNVSPVATRPVAGPPDPEAKWRDHPWLARLVRWSIFLIPIVVSFVFALAATAALPEADSRFVGLVRWVSIAVASTLVLLVMQRLAKRFIPLAALFSLTLVFPDSAPSRFGLALRTGTPKQLQAKLDHLDEDGLGDTPREAAESLLELVAALSRHDRMTRGHSERVRAYARIIGEEMELDEDELDRLHWAALLHDVGKLYVPDEILNKPGPLTDEEFAVIKSHTVAGQQLVEPLADWLGPSVSAVWEHHERWEGGGYPTGKPSEQSPLASRIICVADAFDVMTSARSYKRPMSASNARAELERCAGTQFDPSVVRAMLSVSLGRLWRAMGPLSLVAQISLVPRRLTQGGAAVAMAVAALIALLLTGIASGLPWSDNSSDSTSDGDVPGVVADGDGNDDGTTPPPTVPPTVPPPSTDAAVVPPPEPTVPVPTPTSAPTTVPSTTTSTSTSTSTTSTTTTIARRRPPTTVVPTPVTTLPRATTTTTTPPPTTAPPTTTTTTSPTAPKRLTVASSAAGDVSSQETLDLLTRAPINTGHPNYDVDRNSDPGLTIVRSATNLASADPDEVQAWRAPTSVVTLAGPVRLQLWFAPASPGTGGFAVVAAGLYDCPTVGSDCVTLAEDVGVFDPVDGTFSGVSFDLTPVGGSYSVPAGRVIELRVASPSGSGTDVFVAYDSVSYPATLTFG